MIHTGEAFRLIIQVESKKTIGVSRELILATHAGISVEHPDAQLSKMLEQMIVICQEKVGAEFEQIASACCHVSQMASGQPFVLFGLRFFAVVQDSGPSIFSGEVVIDPEMAKLDNGRIADIAQVCLDETLPILFSAYESWPYELF
jgi:hypothetical protein